MAVPGRKPLPTRIKKLKGSDPRYINEHEPQPAPADPGVPRGRLNDEAKWIWRKLAPGLAETGILREWDLPAMELMCTHFAFAVEAGRILNEEGLSTVDERGLPRKHPLLQIWRENSRDFLRYGTEFGLTPSSRSRLTVEPVETETLADLLFTRTREGGDDE